MSGAAADLIGVPGSLVRPWAERVLNVLLFIPLAGPSVLAWPRRSPTTVALAWTVASLAVETVQGLVLPDRHPSVLDVLLNGSGAALGACAGARLHTRRARLARRS